jgi:ribose transport system permease protein
MKQTNPTLTKSRSFVEQALYHFRLFQSFVGLILVFGLSVLISPCDSHGANIFLSVGNLTDLLRAMSIVGVMALAMTFVILTAGIDLSVGSILALSCCVVSLLLTRWHPGLTELNHMIVAVLAAIAISTVVGAFNGIVIAKIKIPPFIATLATMIGIRGFTKWLSQNATIDVGFGTDDMAARFVNFVSQKSVIIGVYVVLAVIFAILLSKTVFGRYVRAVGDNERAAKYSGLPIDRVKIWVYALTGLLCGVAGVLFAAKTHQGNPNAGSGYELDVIAAVVIGGTSLSGGKGSVVGTIVGTMIIGILLNILSLRNIDSNIQMMIKAIIIIVAVWIQKRDKAD